MTHRATLLSALAIASLGGFAQAQQLLLPDNHHLVESPTQAYLTGSTSWWGTSTVTPQRFQILYEASHFTGKAGVSGPITLQHLRFRATDTFKNTGGQSYGNVNVRVYKTSLGEANMSTTFADNLPPGVGGTTTTIGVFNYPLLVVGASLGTAPNNWIIDLDLTSAPVVFDPVSDTAGEFNLLVDIDYATHTQGPPVPPAAVAISMVTIQDTTAHGAGIRGKSVRASPAAALVGNAMNPPVLGVEFSGTGGYAALQPARTTTIGLACGGSASTFYELWAHGQAFDMAGGGGVTMTPDNVAAPNTYTVTTGAAPIDLTKINPGANGLAAGSADDGIVNWPLGFTFNYPGGTTNVIRPSTNGFIWLNGTLTDSAFSPSVAALLGNTVATPKPARLAPLWHDFAGQRNLPVYPNAGLHALTDISGGPGNAVCYVTWLNTGEFHIAPAGSSDNTFQCVIHEATGVVEYRYGSMTALTGATSSGALVHAIVGFSRGQIAGVNSVDPQSTDISMEGLVPFTTAVEGGTANVRLTSASTPLVAGSVYGARAFGGQTLSWNVANIPAGTIFAMINLDINATQPGFQGPGITAPGCRISTTLSPVILGFETWLLPPASVTGVVTLPIPHLIWDGVDIIVQAIGLDVFGGPDMVPWASNAIRHTVGLD